MSSIKRYFVRFVL